MTLDSIEAAAAAAAMEAGVALQLDGMQVAVRSLEEQARLCPRYADIRFRLGLLHLARGAYAQAASEFEEALGIHPGYRAALRGLRLTDLLRGRLPEAPAPALDEDATPRDEGLWERSERAYRALAEGSDPIEALESTGLLLRVASDLPGTDAATYRYNGQHEAIDHLFLATEAGGGYVPGSAVSVRGPSFGLGGSDHAALRAAFRPPEQ